MSTSSFYLHDPARLQLRARDRVTGSYPTILRTGDQDRKGNYGVFFDDTKTFVFTASTTVSYPQGLLSGSQYISTSYISAVGNVVAGVGDSHVFLENPGESFGPFF